MGYGVGDHVVGGVLRHRGYGVPAECDHPECDAKIDRGLTYMCGDGHVDSCELFFCMEHKSNVIEDGDDSAAWVCERCFNDWTPFEPKPDVWEWTNHVLTDESWATWRAEEPEWRKRMEDRRAELALAMIGDDSEWEDK